jgi:bacteriocin-like protein
MNELLTRELTNDELALISGGGETDQADFGLRDIYDYWDRQNWSMDAFDRNGDGDGWDEITYTYGALAAATGVVTVNLAATANPAAVPVGMAGALLTVAMVAASGIDTYRYGPNLR